MESGEKTFAQTFKACCMQSCTRLAYEQAQTDPDYAERARKCGALYKLIQDKLGADYLLINQFDAAKNHAAAYDDDLIYQQGFQDCVFLLRWMGLL